MIFWKYRQNPPPKKRQMRAWHSAVFGRGFCLYPQNPVCFFWLIFGHLGCREAFFFSFPGPLLAPRARRGGEVAPAGRGPGGAGRGPGGAAGGGGEVPAPPLQHRDGDQGQHLCRCPVGPLFFRGGAAIDARASKQLDGFLPEGFHSQALWKASRKHVPFNFICVHTFYTHQQKIIPSKNYDTCFHFPLFPSQRYLTS